MYPWLGGVFFGPWIKTPIKENAGNALTLEFQIGDIPTINPY